MTNQRTLWPLFMVLLLAGCTEQPDAPAHTPTSTTRVEANTADYSMALEGCTGGELPSVVPEDWAAAYGHRDFRPRSLMPGTVDVFVRIIQCDRVVLADVVLEDVLWMDAMVAAYQSFDGSTPGGTSIVVDTFVSDPALNTTLANLGIPNHLASMELIETPLGDKIVGISILGSDFSFQIKYPESRMEGGRIQYDAATWYTGPPHTRRTVVADEMLAFVAEFDPIVMEMEGDTHMNRLFDNSSHWTFWQQSRWTSEYRYTFTGGLGP